MSKRKSTNNKKITILIICILFTIIITLIFVKPKNNNSNIQISNEISAETIINGLGSKFISQKESEEIGYTYDIYLNFKEDLYVNNESKERLYTNLMSQVISNLKTSIRFIDESRNLIIRATYISKENRYYYTINGEEDYFIKHDSINSLQNYKEIENTELTINSNILKELIKNNWQVSNDIFGSKESTFEDYDIYFDEGYQVRKISGKVYNIIFKEKYQENIVNNLGVSTDIKKVKDTIGKPSFEKDGIIGYKSKDLYIFFSNDEVSVYRNEVYDYTEFEQILKKYISNEINVKEFTNELTYLWDDYSKYDYNSNYVNLQYANQGVEIYLTLDNTKKITIYNNCLNKNNFSNLIENGKIKCNFEEDLIFNDELERKSKNEQRKVPAYALKEYNGSSSKFYETVKNNKVEFFSVNNEYPSCNLIESINSYIWFSDTLFIYSVSNNGIFYFDLKERKSTELIIGTDNFTFNSYKDGVLTYDENKTLKIGSE